MDCSKEIDSPSTVTICDCGSANVVPVVGNVQTPIVKNPTNNIGFVASTKKIYELLKLCGLQKGAGKFVFDKYVLIVKPDGLGVSVIQQTPDGQFYNYGYVKKSYFNELWGNGNMPINAIETIPDVDYMRKFDKCYVNYDKDKAVVQVYTGKEHILSSRAETAEAIMTARFEPINFDLAKFVPLPKSGVVFDNITFDVRVADLLSMEELLKRKIDTGSKKDKAVFYPFLLNDEGIFLSMGDVDNPITSSLHEKIDTIEYKKPASAMRVIVGEVLTDVLKNLDKSAIIRIHVISPENPVWVSTEILDEGKDVGRFGYIISTKSEEEE
jgi:hypothetical protein